MRKSILIHRVIGGGLVALLLALPSATAVFGQAHARGLRAPSGSLEVVPGIYSLTDSGVSGSDAELEPLADIVGDAQVVALGEAIHTSGSFNDMKTRVFKYLVQHHGFRAIAFESPWEGADRAGDYVRTCAGKSDAALTGLLAIWNNTGVRSLLEWMCGWNQEHPKDPVYLFGFDEQQPEQDADAIREFLLRIGLSLDDDLYHGFDTCDGAVRRPTTGENISTSDHTACLAGLDALQRYYRKDKKAIIGLTSRADLQWARIRVLGLRTWQRKLFARNFISSREAIEVRDKTMATFLRQIRELRANGVRTVVSAHDFHIAKNGPALYGAFTMGTHLQRKLKKNYVTVGLVASRVAVDWPGVACGVRWDVGALPAGSVELQLHALGENVLIVDLSFPGTKTPFLAPGRIHLIDPLVLNFHGTLPMVAPRDHFDGLIYFADARAMTPVGRVPCS